MNQESTTTKKHPKCIECGRDCLLNDGPICDVFCRQRARRADRAQASTNSVWIMEPEFVNDQPTVFYSEEYALKLVVNGYRPRKFGP
jgi:hypothetical protein